MSIIISAQSLKNDGTADFQINAEFNPPPEKLKPMNKFYSNGSAIKFTMKFEKYKKLGIEYGFVPGLLPINHIFGINIIGEEKDNADRGSFICTQAKLTEMQNIIPHLKGFLQKANRTISQEKMLAVEKIIDFERSSIRALIRIAITHIPIIGEL